LCERLDRRKGTIIKEISNDHAWVQEGGWGIPDGEEKKTRHGYNLYG